jgi:cytoskeletal protein CcmA (bactofilin family)
MGRIDNLAGNSELADLKRRVRALETRTPLSDSAVSGGRTRFIGTNSFLIEGSGGVDGTLTVDGVEVVNGTLRITGTLTVSGPTTLGGNTKVSGTLTISGDTSVTGKFTVSGPASINGNMDITGDLDIKGDTTVTGPFHVDGAADFDGRLKINGDTTLSGDLNVDDNGHIDVGDMRIGKSGGRGKVDFGVGELASDGAKIAIQSGAALAGVGGGIAQLTLGGNGFRIDSGGIRIGDLPLSDQPSNLYLDSNNRLWRTSATSGGGVSV